MSVTESEEGSRIDAENNAFKVYDLGYDVQVKEGSILAAHSAAIEDGRIVSYNHTAPTDRPVALVTITEVDYVVIDIRDEDREKVGRWLVKLHYQHQGSKREVGYEVAESILNVLMNGGEN